MVMLAAAFMAMYPAAGPARADLVLAGFDGGISATRSVAAVLPPSGRWDLSAWQAVVVTACNDGPKGAILMLRVDDRPRDPGTWTVNTGWTWLEPGQTAELRVRLIRRMPPGIALFGMRTGPGLTSDDPEAVDPAAVTRIEVFAEPGTPGIFDLGSVRATGSAHILPRPDRFFPFVDEFGQYVHLEWPGKTHAEADLVRRRRDESAALASSPGPAAWDRFGGWAAGPQLEATGWFRTERAGGAWWLVDPDGRLYFAHGIAVVDWRNGTPVQERDGWFRGFPGREDGFKEFLGESGPAVRGHYKDAARVRWFDFWRANLKRKYGEGWRAEAAGVAHRRLRNWGFNSIGAWSARDVCALRRTPYAATISLHGAKTLEGHEGFWHPFWDVFDPSFRETVRGRMAGQAGSTAGDSWCVGYFVDNELSWDDDTALALVTLACPRGQPAKRVLVEGLKERYGAIGRLNETWKASYRSWEALLDSRKVPASLTGTGRDGARDDLEAFVRRTADTYFRTIREEVKAVAPHQLYLGCRFAWYGDVAVRAAAAHCDVLSFNFYRRSVSGVELPKGVDAPVLSGEFHFGALDRGQFDPGMVEVSDQAERARAYREYVEGALRHPLFVGTTWFQYMDQPLTGRPLDGEPAAVGFVDICDTPYPEMVAASRDVGERLYRVRREAFSGR